MSTTRRAVPRVADGSPEAVSFLSSNLRIAALFFPPTGGSPAPAVVLCQGTIGVKEHYRFPELAGALAAQGYGTLVFDYRGLGESEGTAGRFMPLEQAGDVRSAITYLSGRPDVDSDRIGLVGFCWGGPHAVYVGSTDPRIKCVAEVVGMSNGRRWLRGLRRYSEWQEFLDRLASDRVRRADTGSSEVVPMRDILVGSPKAKEGRARIATEIAPAGVPYRNPDLTLESAEAILEYRPEDVVGQLAPRPLLIIHAERDDLVPLEEAEALFGAAGEPKELVVLDGCYHHDVYLDPVFGRIRDRLIAWLEVSLRPSKPRGLVADA